MMSSSQPTNPNKRTRVEDLDALDRPSEASNWIRHPELYMPDGNIVLLCENTLFRVYGGVLAINSEVFKGMLSLGGYQPADAENYDSCPLIRLLDRSKDMERLLNALLIAGYIPQRYPEFEVIASILRLSKKYIFTGLRNVIEPIFARGYHTRFCDYLSAEEDDNAIFAREPHPNKVLNLLLECGFSRFLPFAYYKVCATTSSIFDAWEDNRLSLESLQTASEGFIRLQKEKYDAAKTTLSNSSECTCTQLQKIQVALMKEAWMEAAFDMENPRDFWTFTGEDVPDVDWCGACNADCDQNLEAIREDMWQDLPAIFGLLPWEDLTNFEV